MAATQEQAVRILQLAREELPTLLGQTETLVRMESPSDNKAACDAVMSVAAEWARAQGASVRMHRHRAHGDSLEARFPGMPRTRGEKPLLLLGHLDTVWPLGTLARMPYRVTRERISGPGVLDMKAGVAMAFAAQRVLAQLALAHPPVTLLLHADEEIGSPASRSLTEAVAQRCGAVYVLEPGQGVQGAYKTARKGVGRYRLDVMGVGSHSGVDFEAGHSAVLELAHQLGMLARLTDLTRGITVNPGVIGGGTLSNVVAEHAWAEIDVRVVRRRDAVALQRKLQRLRAKDPGCQLAIEGGMNRPPMERTRPVAALFARARSIAQDVEIALEEAATGGGSDGNFTAALGVPTLDGMGAVGAGAHASHEHLLRKHLAPRTALLAAMCLRA